MRNVNPYRYPELSGPDSPNSSISEAEFRLKARYRYCVKGLNEQRFNLYLLMICRLRQIGPAAHNARHYMH